MALSSTAATIAAPPAWLRCSRPVASARIRLLCVPHAGGGASSYQGWSRLLPPRIELWAACLPGREARVLEDPFRSMADLMAPLGAAVAAWRNSSALPYALLGHSMGALIAFELARLLSGDGGPRPACLFVSGQGAPHLSAETQFHLLPDAEFIEHVVHGRGAAGNALRDPELRELCLPALRSDFQLTETYRHRADSPLTCPIVTWAGDADGEVSQQEVTQWAAYSTGRVRHRVFPGDHFFAGDNPAAVLPTLSEDLREQLAVTARS